MFPLQQVSQQNQAPKQYAKQPSSDDILTQIDHAQPMPGGAPDLKADLIIEYLPLLATNQDKLLLSIAMYMMSKVKGNLSVLAFETALDELSANSNAKVEDIQTLGSLKTGDLQAHVTMATTLYTQRKNNQPQISATHDVQLIAFGEDPAKSNLPAGAFVEFYQRFYPVLNQGLSLRKEVDVNSTCSTLYGPYQLSMQMVNRLIHPSWLTSFNPFTSEATIQDASSERTIRYTNAYFSSAIKDNLQLLNEQGLSPYTQQQIIEGHFTIAQTKELDRFINQFKEKEFADKESCCHWLKIKIEADPLLQRCFSPGYLHWWRCVDSFSATTKNATFDLELALLICSTGVQQYACGDPEKFVIDLIVVSLKRDDPITAFKSLLNAFNNKVFQAYIAKGKLIIDRESLLHFFGWDYDYWRGDEYDSSRDDCHANNMWFIREHNKNRRDTLDYATNPILKKYVDEGAISDLAELISMSVTGLELFCSPTVRQGYENGEYTLENLKWLISRFTDHAFSVPNNVAACFYEGHFTFKQLVSLKDDDKIFFNTNWISREIHTGKLTYDDLIWMYTQVYEKNTLTHADITDRSSKFIIYFNLYKAGLM